MPPYSEASQVDISRNDIQPKTGFTSGLLETILSSKAKMERWAEFEKAKADQVAESYRRKLVEEQATIDSQGTCLMAVQMERGLNVNDQNSTNNGDHAESIADKKKALEELHAELEREVDNLQTECENREKRVLDVEAEEAKQNTRAQEARALKERVKEAKQTTVDDLTRGIVNYKHLGLDFEKTEGENEMRFFFSQLDPNDPGRQFSFVLQVDDEDRYEIANCLPSVDAGILSEISDKLNDTDDMSYLARKMRRVFAETL